MIAIAYRSLQFLIFHVLISIVDRVSRLPRSGVQPEVERILRENLALKAQVRALVLELKSERGSRPKVSLRTRAAQVFAYLLTRGDKALQNYYLSASRTTIAKWATKLRRGPWLWRRMGKGGLAQRPARHRPAHARDPRAARLRRMGPHLRVDDPHLRERDPPRGTSARGGRPRSRHPLPRPVRAPAPGPGYRTAAHAGGAALRERNG